MKLVGPKDTDKTFAVDGGLLKLSQGVATFLPEGGEPATEEIPEGVVPDNVYGFGFTKVEEKATHVSGRSSTHTDQE